MVRILHTEASPGWGGQELRILREAEGMQARGHQVFLVVQKGGGLVEPARKAGFTVYEVSFKKKNALSTLFFLIKLMRKLKINVVNTHSSLDAWIGGLAARLCGLFVIRTRHLSTPIKAGLNSWLLYKLLADRVVTTCKEVVGIICKQAKLSAQHCRSIPTGIDPRNARVDPLEVAQFREKWGIGSQDFVLGTLCVLRGWKGVSDFLQAAKLLENIEPLKWLIVGSGVSEEHFRAEWRQLGLEKKVIFTGYLEKPYTALAAVDVFLLLSWANEGVSQATLQAGLMGKPLIATEIGGLKEVCLNQETGLQVPTRHPEAVSKAVMDLYNQPDLRQRFGQNAKKLVLEQFTLEQMLDQMEALYAESANV